MRTLLSVSRTIIGIALTIALLLVVHRYVEHRGGWGTIWSANLNDIGQFIGGVAAALAFLWLVLGYLQQGEDLRLQREELRLQREEVERLANEAKRQATAVEANELHARRDTFLRVADILIAEQTALASRIAHLMGHDIRKVWEVYGLGNKDAFFVHAFYFFVENQAEELRSVASQKRELRRSIAKFCTNFESLLSQAQHCDPDSALRLAFENSAMGDLYAGMCLIFERKICFQVRPIPVDREDIR